MENIETGLLLMVVGMTTVFAILLIVINLGKGLIVLVNKYTPEEIIAKKPVAARAGAGAPRVRARRIRAGRSGTNGHSNANHRNRQSFRTGDSRHRIGNQRRDPWTGESYQN